MIDLLALLKRIETRGTLPDDCPECEYDVSRGHKEGCQLAEAIRMLEGVKQQAAEFIMEAAPNRTITLRYVDEPRELQ